MSWRKQFCRLGHPLSGDNLLITRSSTSVKDQRICRTCKRANARRLYDAAKRREKHLRTYDPAQRAARYRQEKAA